MLCAVHIAAHLGTTNARLVIDNLQVKRAAEAALRGGGPPATCPSLWAMVARLAASFEVCSAHWCPSHGKHQRWIADAPTETDWRRYLNKRADAEATKAMRELKQPLEHVHRVIMGAHSWTLQAVAAQAAACRAYLQQQGAGAVVAPLDPC